MSENQLQVRFVTTHEDLRVPGSTFAVPAELKRGGLSELINALLDSKHTFDFSIGGRLVRTSIRTAVARAGLSHETTIDIEYFLAVPAPKPGAPTDPFPEWIGGISAVKGTSAIVSACYDGSLYAHTAAGVAPAPLFSAINPQPVGQHNISGSPAVAVTSWGAGGAYRAAVGTKAGDVTIVDLGANGASPTPLVRNLAHQAAVSGLCVSPDGERVVSVAQNGTMCVWDTCEETLGELIGDDGDGAIPSGKRTPAATPVNTVPMAAFSVHSGRQVSCASWSHSIGSEHLVHTGGYDSRVTTTDVSTGEQASTLFVSRPVQSLASGPDGALFATAHHDSVVRVWDRRAPESQAKVMTLALRGHTAWVGAVAWRPDSATHLASVDYAGEVRLWDVRTRHPLHVAPGVGSGKKLLGLAWADKDTVVCGGEDTRVHSVSFADM